MNDDCSFEKERASKHIIIQNNYIILTYMKTVYFS